MRNSWLLAASIVSLLVGCVRSAPDAADNLVWVEEGVAHEDVVIDLGYRNALAADEGNFVVPVARITRAGAPVANAMVFSSLASTDGEATGDEVATVYEPSPNADAAYYRSQRLQLPDSASKCVVRYRIVLPGNEQGWTRDVTIPVN